MKHTIAAAALAVAIFALPLTGSAQGYYQPAPAAYGACPVQAACPQVACPPTCQDCFNPLGIVGDVFRGVGSVISGVGSIFGPTYTSTCY